MTPEDRERLVRIEENTKQLVKRGIDHERRIRRLEKAWAWAAGVVAAIGFIWEVGHK
jgi:hypothetical protein